MEAVKVKSGTLVLIPGQDPRALLSPEQAMARAHNVAVLRKFERFVLVAVNEPLHFKAGEVLGIALSKARRDQLETLEGGPLSKAAAKVRDADEADKLADKLAKEAAASAVAKAKREEEAKAAYAASPDLQKKFPDVEIYLASLEPPAKAS